MIDVETRAGSKKNKTKLFCFVFETNENLYKENLVTRSFRHVGLSYFFLLSFTFRGIHTKLA